MKRLTILLLFMIIGIASISAQNKKTKINPEGTWKFEAPYAPAGYTSGSIVVGQTEQKHTATMSFTGNENKLSGQQVKIINDSILFSVYLEGQDVRVMLKLENEAKMTGKAVYTDGEVPLTLTKSANQVNN